MKNVAGQHFVFISCSGSLLIHYDYVENFINIFLYRWLGVNKISTQGVARIYLLVLCDICYIRYKWTFIQDTPSCYIVKSDFFLCI